MTATKELSLKDFKSEQKSTWCPGCGDFGILSAVQTALVNSGIAPWEVLLVSGIGCGSKLPDYINANGFLTLHGRGVTIATGAHLANTDLKIIAIGGDGDSYGIGLNHALHNMRRNMNIVHLVENNEIYGLTKGQYSPVSKRGTKTSTSPEGAIDFAVNPGELALAAGATFIAYGYSGDPKLTADLIQKGLEHKGYALINILQVCPSYQKLQNNEWFKEHIFKIEEEIPDYNPRDKFSAYSLLTGSHAVWQKENVKNKLYPLGVIYEDKNKPIYSEQVHALQTEKTALVKRSLKVNEQLVNDIKASYV